MEYCGYLIIGVCVILYFYGLLSDMSSFQLYSPTIVRITPYQSLYSTQDPPLYRALMEGLEPHTDYPINNSSQALYSSNMFAATFISPNHTQVQLFTIRSDIYTNLTYDPFHCEISIYSCSIEDLISKNHEINGDTLGTTIIPGSVIFLTGSSENLDVLIVYKVIIDEGNSFRIRYYSDRTLNIYEDFELPGGLGMNSITMEDNVVAYSRRGDTKAFRTLYRIKADIFPDESTLYSKDGIIWVKGQTGDHHDRNDFGLSEVTGLKLIDIDGLMILCRTWVKSQTTVISNAQSVTEFFYMNITQGEILDDFYYNLTLKSLLPEHPTLEDLYQHPWTRISSNKEYIYLGHMNNLISRIHGR